VIRTHRDARESRRENFCWERSLARDIMKKYSDAFVVTQRSQGMARKAKKAAKKSAPKKAAKKTAKKAKKAKKAKRGR
jgi:hypothetical protein